MTTVREVRLRSYPVGAPSNANFDIAEGQLPPLRAGEVRVRNLWLSVDPFVRLRMQAHTAFSLPLGETIPGATIGEVAASKDPAFEAGDLVQSDFGWREGFVAEASRLRKLDAMGLPPQVFLGAAGLSGLTAYVGLLRTAALTDGDIVFVSGGAGAVGSMAVQIAKARGHTVIASAGGPEKAAFLREIGADEAIDYKAEADLTAALGRAAPSGIDVYFDNVGGSHLQAAIEVARPSAKIALCGQISTYNAIEPQPGPSNLIQVILKQIRMEGFALARHMDLQAAFLRDLAGWVRAGKLTWKETVFEGIETAPGAFLALFSGGNLGKTLVKLA